MQYDKTRPADVPILVVEDDPVSARLLMAALARVGATVRVALNAEDAVAILKDFSACMIVVDLVLPRMSGLLLVEELKRTAATRDTPVIAVSVLDGPETERVALDSGCVAFVRKPIDLEAFATTVFTHLKDRV